MTLGSAQGPPQTLLFGDGTPLQMRLFPPLPFASSRPFFFAEDDQRAYCVSWWSTFGPVEHVAQKPDALPPNLIISLGGGSSQQAPNVAQGSTLPIAQQSNWKAPMLQPPMLTSEIDFDFSIHFHPFAADFVRAMRQGGAARLLTPAMQALQEVDTPSSGFKIALLGTEFERHYKPSDRVQQPYPFEDVDFSANGAYAPYNWEIFFHIPLRVASQLLANQKFEEAQAWLRYVFDPTDGSGQFWKVHPFTTIVPERIDELLMLLATPDDQLDPQQLADKATIASEVDAMRLHPFEPYRIARLRPGAFMKNAFMTYLDVLIAWGDQLFAQDTIETINQAMQLYVMAADLLGPRPERIPRRGTVAAATYADLEPKLDAFSNALVSLENDFPFSSSVSSDGDGGNALLGGGSDALLLCTAEREDARVLGHGRRPSLQDSQLHEHRRRGPDAAAVRPTHRPRTARRGGGEGRRPWQRTQRSRGAPAVLSILGHAATGDGAGGGGEGTRCAAAQHPGEA